MGPILYEINTRCWLHELAANAGRAVTLDTIPEREFAEWRRLGFTHIWLMGVWTSGPLARAKALVEPGQCRAYSEALPDWREDDVAGSPYAIADYRVPATLGGEAALAAFRRKLNDHGLKLILDFVPNHLGLDHPWIHQRPDLFVQSLRRAPETFLVQSPAGPRWLAHGKDPYFPAWTDTVQLDYRRGETRGAMGELLQGLAERCDGVRCDMAMLLLNQVFERTWQAFPVLAQAERLAPGGFGPGPGAGAQSAGLASASLAKGEFWAEAIARVKQAHPGFLFLAEAYWGLEPRLLELGFEFVYDKELMDELVAPDPTAVQQHLDRTPADLLARGAHFLENHDEPRIAGRLSVAKHRARALLILALPGMRFLHEGQLRGAKIKVPVQLARRPVEAVVPDIQEFYDRVLMALPHTAVGQGTAVLVKPRAAWPGNPTGQNLVLIQWAGGAGAFDLVVVNLAAQRSQGYVPLNVEALSAHSWSIRNLLGEESFLRSGKDLLSEGLYLDVEPHAAQLLHAEPAT